MATTGGQSSRLKNAEDTVKIDEDEVSIITSSGQISKSTPAGYGQVLPPANLIYLTCHMAA